MINIPNKSHFKMNEVCGLAGVKPYVLRFWESEFEQINPINSASGQKLYEHKDIEAVAFIKKLLFDDKLNIEEAKRELVLRQSSSETKDDNSTCEDLQVARDTLSEGDINGLYQAKGCLKNLIARVDSLKQAHHWS